VVNIVVAASVGHERIKAFLKLQEVPGRASSDRASSGEPRRAVLASVVPIQSGGDELPVVVTVGLPGSSVHGGSFGDGSSGGGGGGGSGGGGGGGACFRWRGGPAGGLPTLSGVELCLARGTLTAVLGACGSGKSTLLAALLGEVPVVKAVDTAVDTAVDKAALSIRPTGKAAPGATAGVSAMGKAGEAAAVFAEVSLREQRRTVRHHFTDGGGVTGGGGLRIGYASQRPFIQNATLRENVVMGDPHVDEAAYARVLAACALLPDLRLLPAGDATEIGEKVKAAREDAIDGTAIDRLSHLKAEAGACTTSYQST